MKQTATTRKAFLIETVTGYTGLQKKKLTRVKSLVNYLISNPDGEAGQTAPLNL